MHKIYISATYMDLINDVLIKYKLKLYNKCLRLIRNATFTMI